MKRVINLLIFLPFAAFAQNKVGINTKTPTATLDVNGDMAVRSVVASTTDAKTRDSVLVMDGGVIKATTAAKVVTLGSAAGSSATIGDVKTGIQPGGINLDGRDISNLPDATGA